MSYVLFIFVLKSKKEKKIMGFCYLWNFLMFCAFILWYSMVNLFGNITVFSRKVEMNISHSLTLFICCSAKLSFKITFAETCVFSIHSLAFVCLYVHTHTHILVQPSEHWRTLAFLRIIFFFLFLVFCFHLWNFWTSLKANWLR